MAPSHAYLTQKPRQTAKLAEPGQTEKLAHGSGEDADPTSDLRTAKLEGEMKKEKERTTRTGEGSKGQRRRRRERHRTPDTDATAKPQAEVDSTADPKAKPMAAPSATLENAEAWILQGIVQFLLTTTPTSLPDAGLRTTDTCGDSTKEGRCLDCFNNCKAGGSHGGDCKVTYKDKLP